MILAAALVTLGLLIAATAVSVYAFFGASTDVPDNTFKTSCWTTCMPLATGSYVGDGVDDRPITGVGFLPDVVFVKCDCGRAGVARTSTMIGDAAKPLNSTAALQPNLIQSFDADGFTVGTDLKVNNPGKTHYWVAMKAGTHLALGTYVGDGTDDRSITGIGLQPVWVATFGDGNDSIFRPATVGGDGSYRFPGTGKLADRIQALEADGFQIGTNQDVNLTGITYHYVAWKAGASAVQSSYTGNGTDDRSISGVGFQPQMVWVKRDTMNQAIWRQDSVSGDASLYWGATAANPNRIQALEADGFQVGTHGQVNSSGKIYHYIAFKDEGP